MKILLKLSFCSFLLIVLSLFYFSCPALAEPLAVIVNKHNPTNDISVKDLARLYNGAMSRWKDGQNILMVHFPKNANIRQDFDRIVFASTNGQVGTSKLQAENATVTIENEGALIYLVSSMPNAIGYTYAHKLSDKVKVLRVEGYEPSQGGYPLK